ncbi:MAG: GNAT family N-acetyltransferase [Janthinobacterium lividum]
MARTIRPATSADAEACAAIYAPYVRDTVISFEAVPPSSAEMASRIEQSSTRHAWLVMEDDDTEGDVMGYAYAGPYSARAAYDWSCEVSVYLRVGSRRTGAGRALYEALFGRLEERGFRTLVAGITEPNEASSGLHRALGFRVVGTFRDIGFKDGAWHDVTRWQRCIGPDNEPPTDLA